EPEADIDKISESLHSSDTFRNAFDQLDANHDNQVGVGEIFNFNGTGASEIRPLLEKIAQEMQFGAGGEKMKMIPKLTFPRMLALSRPGAAAMLQSNLEGFSTASALLPA
ncbi:MAG: hypothetical protein ABR589_05775, partial [Chthoniobacterales bacterium]